jgi:Arc/MetJ-type ribon-helix-helix transcriptional regulator
LQEIDNSRYIAYGSNTPAGRRSEIVREGLRLLKEKEELKKLQLDALRNEIAIGGAQADRGEFVNGEQAFAEIRRGSARRKGGGHLR